ncbi:MAG: EVE domain-containing protein [Rhizobiaceae bacterium]
MAGQRDDAPRNWVAVASAEHVRRGEAGGFMQVNHGKQGPLKRIKPGDRVVYYSPSEVMRVADGLQSFTALGVVRPGDIRQGVMAGDFRPFRRDVDWRTAQYAPIRPLLDRLQLTAGKTNWGAAFRFGLIEISDADFETIKAVMTG